MEPTKEEILNRFKLILQGTMSREEVADWASEYVMQDCPNVTDETVWDLLLIACGVDLKDSPDEYLHDEQNIKDWIKEFSV